MGVFFIPIMRQVQFSNAGVAQVQARILSLPLPDRMEEAERIAASFTEWMESTFTLTEKHRDQLQELPAGFRQQIAIAVSQAWKAGEWVFFNKEDKGAETKSGGDDDDDDRHPSPKEILFSTETRQRYHLHQSPPVALKSRVDIQILYTK